MGSPTPDLNGDERGFPVDDDLAAADAARLRFRNEGVAALPPDERIAPLLLPDERVVAVRPDVVLDRRTPVAHDRAPAAPAGDLYVTERRLVLVGRVALAFELDAIEDALVAAGRLLLVLRDGQGVSLQVPCPRLLWAEIVAARSYGRRRGPPTPHERVGQAPAR